MVARERANEACRLVAARIDPLAAPNAERMAAGAAALREFDAHVVTDECETRRNIIRPSAFAVELMHARRVCGFRQHQHRREEDDAQNYVHDSYDVSNRFGGFADDRPGGRKPARVGDQRQPAARRQFDSAGGLGRPPDPPMGTALAARTVCVGRTPARTLASAIPSLVILRGAGLALAKRRGLAPSERARCWLRLLPETNLFSGSAALASLRRRAA